MSIDAKTTVIALGSLAIAGCAQILGLGEPDLASDRDAGTPVAALSALTIEAQVLSPAFDPAITEYQIQAPFFASDAIVTASAEAGVGIEIDGTAAVSGTAFDPIAMSLGENSISIEASVGDDTRRYTIDFVRGRDVLEYVKASNTDAGDRFGEVIALSNNTLAVAARFEESADVGIDGDQADNSIIRAGAVYIFTRTDGTWSQQAYIKASNTDPQDFFGASLALSGDTLVVGATGEDAFVSGINGDETDNQANNAGAVYVFTRTGALWSQQAYVKASNANVFQEFGSSVALDGDTLAVGSRGESSAANGVGGDQTVGLVGDAGAAYVFTRAGATWTQQAYIKASNTSQDARFGSTVALRGDTLAVGAPGEATEAFEAGAVYVFTRTGATWSQQALLRASNAGQEDSFGSSLALSGDTLAVGANGEASAATGVGGNQTGDGANAAGAVYVFARVGTIWSQQAYVKASNTAANDRFGSGVALDGDTLAVAAGGEDSADFGVDGDQDDDSALEAGSVYVFTRVGTTWNQRAYAKASNAGAGDGLGSGSSIALDGGVLVVGANGEDGSSTGVGGIDDNSALEAGAVYVFE